MKIFIVGLGIIGASYAEGLHRNGHKIYAYNRSERPIIEGIKLGFIESDNSIEQLSSTDLVILALYPKYNIEFVKKHLELFKPGQIVTDVSGTKVWMMNELEKILPQGISYTSHHPMAGKETSGFDSRDEKMFRNANFIIVTGKRSLKRDQDALRLIANNLKFGKITVVQAKIHDELIAFTSQLTHVIAVALMQSDQLKETKEATGDSFRDLTRIAKINEVMWSELFLENKDELVHKINDFTHELQHVKELILLEDKESLMKYLKEAKEKRKDFDIH
ncbi:MAG: prephenate dehydrogenase [Acholeplasmataceae bacterium]|nr:prephenate dehydrogenase [Acholeplasmataceae bacterium]